jgi:hypothetical protein
MHNFFHGSSITKDDGVLHIFTRFHLRTDQGSSLNYDNTTLHLYSNILHARCHFRPTIASLHCRSETNNITIVGHLSRASRNVPLLRRKRCTKMTCSVTELDTDSAVRLLKGLACLLHIRCYIRCIQTFPTPPSSSAHINIAGRVSSKPPRHNGLGV